MFIYFISIIITILTLSIFSSIFSLKTNFIHIDFTNNEILVVKEKIIKEAVDSYCRNNFTECIIDNNETMDINQSIISDYYSENFEEIEDLNITISQEKLTIFHNVDENYKKLKDNQFASCLNDDCTNISKVFDLSEELKIKYLLYNIIQLENEIQIINNEIQIIDNEIAVLQLEDPVDQVRINELISQKNELISQKNEKENEILELEAKIENLNQVILSRKVGGL